MSKMNWGRPTFRIQGRETEDINGRDVKPGKLSGRRRRRKARGTMLSDGTVVSGELTAAEVAALESELARGGSDA